MPLLVNIVLRVFTKPPKKTRVSSLICIMMPLSNTGAFLAHPCLQV